MLKWTPLLLVTTLALGCDLFRAEDSATDPESNKNPDYLRWADFSPGAWALYAETEPGSDRRREIRCELLELDERRALVQVKTGSPRLSADSRIEVKELTATVDPALKPRLVDDGREDLFMAGQTLSCRIYRQIARENEREDEAAEHMRLWVCDDVPGGVARLQIHAGDTDRLLRTRTLVDFGIRPEATGGP